MARIIFEDLTIEQARMISHWYIKTGQYLAATTIENQNGVAPLIKDSYELNNDTVVIVCGENHA